MSQEIKTNAPAALTAERVLARKLAQELSTEELQQVSGGHTPPKGETCSGSDCDVSTK